MSATAVQNDGNLLAVDDSEARLGAARYEAATALMESMLHDARNPLNALAINLEVLSEKLKGEGGLVPPSQEKNLRAMREQIARLDGLLRQFSEFMAPRPGAAVPVPVSELVGRALEVCGHEARRKRLKVRTGVDAGLVARPADVGAARFLVLQPLLRAFRRAEVGSEVSVLLRREGARAVLEVLDAAGAAVEPCSGVLHALESEAARAGAQVQLNGSACRVAFVLS